MRILIASALLSIAVWSIVTLVSLPAISDAQHDQIELALRTESLKGQRAEFMENCQKGTRIDLPAPDQPRTESECLRFWISGHLERVFPEIYLSAGVIDDVARMGSLGFLVALVVGASAVGADWQTGQFSVLLQWEPNRTRVFGVRMGVITLGAFVMALLLAVALGIGVVILTVLKGSFVGIDTEWLQESALTVVRLGGAWASGAAIGASLAFIGRRTVAGVGAAVAYLLVGLVAQPLFGRANPVRLFETVDWFVGSSTGYRHTYSTVEAGTLLAGLSLLSVLGAFGFFRSRDVV